MSQVQAEVERLRELLGIAEMQRDEALASLENALEALDNAQAQCADLLDARSIGAMRGCVDVFGQPD